MLTRRNEGTRLGITNHTEDNKKVSAFRLAESDYAMINSVLERSNGSQLYTTVGDCGAEYR